MSNLTHVATVPPVTEPEFWANVGRQLRDIRLRTGFEKTYSAYRAGAPATATMNDIEEGRVGNVDSLTAYCSTLKVSLLDVLRVALDESDDPLLDADAHWVGLMFQEGPDEDARKGMLALAKSQAAQRATSSAATPVAPTAPKVSTGGSRGRARTGRGH